MTLSLNNLFSPWSAEYEGTTFFEMSGIDYPVMQHHIPEEQILNHTAMKRAELAPTCS
jgi:hypothetical protein